MTKEDRVLLYIANHIKTKGFAPAIREITEAEGLKTSSIGHVVIKKLIENGYITAVPRQPRTLRITDQGQQRLLELQT